MKEIKAYIKTDRVEKLVQELKNAGYHQITWNGKDNSRTKVGTGIYLH